MYLTCDELTKRFSVNASTIWRWVKKKEFPGPIKLGGATTRWKTSDVEAWEAEKASAS